MIPLLAIVIFVNMLYPLSERGTIAAVSYLVVYILLFGFGVFVASVSRARFMIAVLLMLICGVVGAYWLVTPTDTISRSTDL